MTEQPVNKKPPIWKRKYLIYPKFQATLILLNAVVILTSFLMVGILLKIQKQAYVQQGQEEGAPSVYAHFLDMYFSDTVNYLIVATVISLTATSLFTLLLSHRIAGPIYRLVRFFTTAASTASIPETLRFRASDYFQELPPVINQALKVIEEKHPGSGPKPH
jgi:hypothetical protein